MQDPWTAEASPAPFDASSYEASLAPIAVVPKYAPSHGQSQPGDRVGVFREYH